MTDLQTLYLTFVVLWLVEGILWLPSTAVLFVTYPWAARLRAAGAHLGGERGQLLMTDPWPGLALPIAGQFPGLWFSPDFVLRIAHPASSHADSAGSTVPVDNLGAVQTDDDTLFLDGRPFVKLGSPLAAELAARLLCELQRSDSTERETCIRKHVRAMFDESEIAATRDQFGRHVLPLRILCPALLLWLLGAAPVLTYVLPLEISVLTILAGYAVLAVAIGVTAYRLSGVQGMTTRWQRVGLLIRILLYPPAAVRAVDSFGLNALAQYHPVALAGVVCRPPLFADFASKVLRHLTYPLAADTPAGSEVGAEALAWYREILREKVAACLLSHGIERTAALTWGLAIDQVGTSYCPRCLIVYDGDRGECSDCAGIRLKPLREL